MAEIFQEGDRVKPSALGIENAIFCVLKRNGQVVDQTTRQGTVVVPPGKSDRRLSAHAIETTVSVRWDGATNARRVHKDFITHAR